MKKNLSESTIGRDLKAAVGVAGLVVRKTNKIVSPIRESALKRFPMLFILLTTFGVAAVFFAFERLIAQSEYLFDRPWLILIVGVMALVVSGQLYKKLG